MWLLFYTVYISTLLLVEVYVYVIIKVWLFIIRFSTKTWLLEWDWRWAACDQTGGFHSRTLCGVKVNSAKKTQTRLPLNYFGNDRYKVMKLGMKQAHVEAHIGIVCMGMLVRVNVTVSLNIETRFHLRLAQLL